MDPLLHQFERSVGDAFAAWLTRTTGYPCTFLRRAGEAPDLVYSFRGKELFIEVTGAYYDPVHAQFLWMGARGKPGGPTHWEGAEPDKSLAESVLNCVQQKSLKRYGENTVLLVNIPPGVTRRSSLESLLAGRVQDGSVFAGIYVAGTFPKENDLGGEYQVLPLKALPE